MAEKKFTKGDWRIEECSGGFELKCGVVGWLFKLYDGRQEDESDQDFLESQDANAHLISAAPEMYAALEHCATMPELTEGHRGALQTILAKARGEANPTKDGE